MFGRGWKAVGLALTLAGLVHCTTFAGVSAEGSSSSDLVDNAKADAGDAGDASPDGGDAGDAGDAEADAAPDADVDADVDAAPVEEPVVDAAPPKKKPTKPVEPGDAADDAGETDLASRFPDPSTVHLGALPDGESGCSFAPPPSGIGAPVVLVIALASLRRRRRR